jgi:hypothetical protein
MARKTGHFGRDSVIFDDLRSSGVLGIQLAEKTV